MSAANLRLERSRRYQVWVTSWPEDGSEASVKAVAACTHYHAFNRLVGQCNDIAEAVRIHDANQAYEPYITKLVTWKTEVKEVV